MSSTKEYWFAVQEEQKEAWIRDHLEDEDSDEYSDEWERLSEEYDEKEESFRAQAELEEELYWLNERSYSEEYIKFNEEISKLKEMLNKIVIFEFKETIIKMTYAHSVTLLESYLSDTLKLLVVKHPNLLENAILNVDGLKKAKFSLTQINKSPNGVVSLVLGELSDYLYHNIPKVINVYSAVLGCKLNLDISEIDTVTKVRHDIVHRDAKTKDGSPIVLNEEVALKAVTDIEIFVHALQEQIDGAMNL
ncbi:HEPN domain-containing protein [Thalassotalea sp. G2M2-11]|uniref:HEPN domain-containing protein n=1 Tax=Thalassotalea sp. G2M2-11 TaxID=2787627 RepID=UPI0019D1FD39|nr:HEPN domain-containing protein [Thalassotalea sp. G2M2-11]